MLVWWVQRMQIWQQLQQQVAEGNYCCTAEGVVVEGQQATLN
jgi:hypothetical protein